MYTIYYNTGEVYRNSDSVLVAPTNDATNTDYLDYVSWVTAGNEPTPGAISPSRLIAIQIQLSALILAERDRRRASGVKVGSNWFHTDDPSRIQQIALVMFGANMPSNIMWKTMTGTFVPMTPTLAMQIFQSSAASDMTLFAIAEQKKTAMLASATPDTYNYLTGWPLSFGE